MTVLTHPTLADVTVIVEDSRAPEWLAAGWKTTGPEAADPGTTTTKPRRGVTKEK